MQEEIQAAVDWWCKQLRQESLGSSGDADIDMSFALANRTDVHPLSEEKISAFQSSLTRMLIIHFEQFSYYGLIIDYGPEGLLRDALTEAKINNATEYLPMKTKMSIRAGSVQVACGYVGQYVTIYPIEQAIQP